MPDPVTLSAGAIAALAFQEFIKSGSGELAKKFTGEAIAKIGQLRELIWTRLTGKHPAAVEALGQAKAGDKEGIDIVTKLLDVEMLDKSFAEQVQGIAREINAGKILESSPSTMTQHNYCNAIGWQVKVEGGTANIGENHIRDQGS
jgi:hypothetical protein